ncbi:MAG: hypothetical protein KKE31_04735, partial [Planctomycetes bacterium]|nr:hypothetical protein [Planctomycetota bacterium]
RLEALELEKLLNNAANLSPELWATIKQSIEITDLVSNSTQTDIGKKIKVYSGAETTSAYYSEES